ncbi:MAG TPA: extracellular solute-binding protein [Ruminiclostridium sp.]|nr:extracellular solute-binding protein [Ruminiclostridium sp.]
MKKVSLKRALCFAVAAALSVGLFSGCSGSSGKSNSNEKVTLKFVTKIPEDERQACIKKIIAEFEKAHPNIKIQQQAYGDEEIKDKLKVLLGSDEAPDIYFSWSGQRLQGYVDQNLALDITKYLDGDKTWKDNFNQSMLATAKKNNAYYAVPWDYSSKEFFYNKAVFAAAGISSAPRTWDEFLQDCQILKDKGYTPIAVGNQYPWVVIHYITTLNQKLVPANVLKANYDGTNTKFSDPGYVKALNTMKDLYDKGYINKDVNSATYEMSQSMVIEGKAGMIYDETQIMSKYDESKFGYFDFPEIAGEAGKPGYVTGGPDLYVVNSKTKYPDQAVEFIKFLTNKESQQAIVKDIQFMPVVNGAATTETAKPEAIEIINKNQKAPGVAEWLDCVLNQTVADEYLSAAQDIFNGTSADKLMAKISEVAADAS